MKLNIGAADTELPGFTPVDIRASQNAAKLEYADDSIEEIYASHVFEHFSYHNAADVLAEWVRVLKPGGRIRIAVPDFDWVVKQYISQSDKFNIEGILMGGHSHEHDVHLAIYNEPKLRAVMERAGLERIERWQPEINDCSSLECSLNLQGFKPSAGQTEKPAADKPRKLSGVMAVMSLPRLAFTDNMFTIMQSLPPLGIPIMKTSGVFYGQCMQGMLEDAIAANAKYVLTIDYDSVFTKQNVIDLYDLMEANPGIDAMIPLQMRRESDFALFTVTGDDGKVKGFVPLDDLKKDVMKVNSGHFGLTMLRVESLRKLSLPWFWAQPDKDGRWTGDDKKDDDVYFWHKWKDEGMSVFLAPRVVIGHIQQFVTWPSKTLTPIHQSVSQWYKSGKPGEAM